MDSDGVRDFPEQFARTRRFSLGVPRSFTVSPDGRRVLFLRTGGGSDPVSRLWLYEDGAERELAHPARLHGGTALPDAERARRERARELTDGIVAYAADAEVRTAVFALGGVLWVVRTGGRDAPLRLPAAGPVVDPRLSPDGRAVAYVTRGALHVADLDGNDRLIAAPDGPEVTYGLSDHVSAESLGRTRGHWWSPDGTALLAARVDTSPVRRRYLGDPARPWARPRPVPYPVAGTANADVSLHVFGEDGGRTELSWDRAAFEYVAAAGWDGHGPLVTVQSRDQRTVRVLAADPGTGATRPLDERRDPAWVELVPGTPLRTDSGVLVQPYEQDGTRGLRCGDRPATPPGLQLREVLSVQGERVLFTASEEPTETHVWARRADGTCVRLSGEPGVHTAAAGGGTLVLDSRTPDGHRVTVYRDGARQGRIASLAEEPSVRPAPVLLRLGRRAVRSRLHLPSGHEPGSGKLPVLLDPYGGPAAQVVLRARHWTGCVSQWFAEQGFAVLVADGRGTQGRGPRWEKAVHGDKLGPALEDQEEALLAAARHCPDLDLGRVAIRGWSYGGYLAAGAVLRRPEVFHAAVAGAAPFDQRLYDTHWQERFLGLPGEHPERYDRSSLIADAPALRRPLLLVHGLADDNVTVAHTLRMSAALLAAGRPHTVLPLPGVSHLDARGDVTGNLLRAQCGFLRRALRIDPPQG
ncbi:prolyl oligopeptidase family serine peptidase [Streptomyces sp. Ru87]|uniref:S9 family peptidase n=1 Tax=Streptomyces sp. Ru87 TaxID=2044307 RepID=UPI000BF3086D|nr:prolyl oligopeptidase family serine peptidase [Streptomyces sp. Ru87]PGH51738.1 S9 family peptidase [Streptomyces sp. Ru87]